MSKDTCKVSPVCLAPKKRFKLDALREMEERSKQQRMKEEEQEEEEEGKGLEGGGSGPFRPWRKAEANNNRHVAAAAGDAHPSSVGPPPARPPVAYLPFIAMPLHPVLPYQLPVPADLLLKGGLPPHVLAAAAAPPPVGRLDDVQEEPLSLVKKDKAAGREGDGGEERRRDDSVRERLCATPPPPAAAAGRRVAVEATRVAGGGGQEERFITSKQRNYKNMTRERRVEANARERQRVHTITAAFDNLQAAIPTEDAKLKLSKLSVIKIATAYIMALSRMAGYDYTEDQSAPPVGEVVENCARLIDAETRAKRRSNLDGGGGGGGQAAR